MQNLYSSIFLLLILTSGYAQIGINVTGTPNSELEIQAFDNDIPALELNPQTAPTGTATGQLAVIDDVLYHYDATRAKWLSVESEVMMFGENSALQGAYTRFGGDLRTGNNGALMPFDGTIVYATGRLSSGDTDKVITIRVRNGTTNQVTQDISFAPAAGTSAEFNLNDVNLDFSAGDYLTVFVAAGDTITEHTVMLWVKWRQ